MDSGVGPKPMHAQRLLYILNHTSMPLQIQIPGDSVVKSLLQYLTSHLDRSSLLDVESALYYEEKVIPIIYFWWKHVFVQVSGILQSWQLMGRLTNLHSPAASSDMLLCVSSRGTSLWNTHSSDASIWLLGSQVVTGSAAAGMAPCSLRWLSSLVFQPFCLFSCCTPGWKPIRPFNQWTGRWMGLISHISVHVRAEIFARRLPALQPLTPCLTLFCFILTPNTPKEGRSSQTESKH